MAWKSKGWVGILPPHIIAFIYLPFTGLKNLFLKVFLFNIIEFKFSKHFHKIFEKKKKDETKIFEQE